MERGPGGGGPDKIWPGFPFPTLSAFFSFDYILKNAFIIFLLLCTQIGSIRKKTPPSPVAFDDGSKPPINLTNPTVASNSFFYIKDPKTSYKTCDVLELYIEVRDGHNVTKKTGGDLLWPLIRSNKLKASAPFNQLTDHGNGSYTARLTLTWAGQVVPQVSFVHSAEYVEALRGVIQRQPVRFNYVSKFTANGTTEYTPCHMVSEMPFIATNPEVAYSYLSPTEVCDYSDTKAGTNWYCLKPATLPCSAISLHRGDWRASHEFFNKIMTPDEIAAWKAYVKCVSPSLALMKISDSYKQSSNSPTPDTGLCTVSFLRSMSPAP
ncbi:NXPE family member 4-like [Acanthaster planci]|uniref:NXPE family member 4-like n=1 Tax=Acanthaster planci TaxID=133434 RepID=A0A8B7YBX0_ACAPL|nr:NXPE family member 4-like [Acanthaster planci]